MVRRIVLIKHEDTARDDRAAAWLVARGYTLDWRFPFAGDRLEAPDESVAGTLLYGGPQPILEIDQHPFLHDEARWVGQCIERDIPTLGICLGGQVIAHALGASVGPTEHGYHEFGYYPLHPTEAGRAYFPEQLFVTQAHYHGFAIPDGAALLAGTERYPHQAFRYGETTFAFQFHPEVTLTGLKRWQDAPWAPWDQPGAQSRAEQDALAAKHDPAQHRWFTAFLETLFAR